MRHLPGQAVWRLWVYTHRLLTLLVTLAVLGGAGIGVLAWRLAQGPLEITWLARRLEAVINDGALATGRAARLDIGSAALVWEGFRDGVDRPLDIRVTDITATDMAGAQMFAVPRAEISLSIRALLAGRFEPRAVELTGPHLRIHRAADGTTTIDLAALMESAEAGLAASPAPGPGIVGAVLAELARSPATDSTKGRDTRLAQLRRIVIRDAAITVVDRQLGTIWRATRANLDVTRRPQGGADAYAELGLTMGGQAARLALLAMLAPDGGGAGTIEATLSPVSPAALARVAPALAPLGILDAAVSIAARLDLGPAFTLQGGGLQVRAGAGRVRLGTGDVALLEAALELRLDAAGLALSELRAAVQARPDGPVSTLTATGSVVIGTPPYAASLSIGLDRFDFTDLPALWPEGAAGDARRWVARNVTAGQGRDARFTLGLTFSPDFAEISVTRAAGTLEADDLTVHWLRPIPPFERARARLRLIDPDSLEIETEGGRQRLDGPRGEAVSGIGLKAGKLHISGLSRPEQTSIVETDIAGPLAEILALLRHPRLRLLDRSPIELREAAGQVQGRISVGLPLEEKASIDDIRITAKARIEQARAAGVVAGRDLEQGTLDLEASNDGLKIAGRAQVAAIPVQFTLDVDFRSGGPAQIVQRVSATARADASQIAAAGLLEAAGYASGPASYQIAYSQRRDGGGEMRVNADLRDSELTVAPLAWRKPPGVAATAEARLRLARDRILGIEDIQINGEALAIRARLEAQEGRLGLLHLDRITLGRTQGRGTVMFQPSGRIMLALNGEIVDLSARLTQTAPEPTPGKPPGKPPGHPWSIDARFNTALVANGARFSGVTLRAENDGTVMQRMRLDGRAGEAPFALEIAPEAGPGAGQRKLTASAGDAGALLRGMDVVHRMAGGQLAVNATYDDRTPDRPLTGTAEITDFRMANAPVLARLLQAMTLYGLLEMAQGPGLGFTRLVAPFRMTDASLELRDARAFGPSLGITLKGRLDRRRDVLDLEGTFVPAHFFNSLLGDIPVIGRLFSPEAGGGLVAFTFALRGPLADPQVLVNPLSALTPGFLRGLFGL